MTLSAPAKKLLSEQPELITELLVKFDLFHKECESQPDKEVLAAPVLRNESEEIQEAVQGQFRWDRNWTKFLEVNTKPTCPHCGIPTDGTSNDQCYKAPNKDWEILAYKSNDSDLVLYRKEWVGLVETQHLYNIYSVKRLSDGEVFTVGDTIDLGIIESFSLNNEFSTGLVAICTNTNKSSIDSAEKAKPLFTTNDGKPVYEGDKIWFVENFKPFDAVAVFHNGKFYDTTDTAKKLPSFSTKSAAEEYIIWNKPLLSLHEICNVFQKNCLYHDSKDGKRKKIEEDLIELSKQKT